VSKGKGRQVTAGSTQVRQLVRQFKPGYRLISAGDSKCQVRAPDGTLVRDPGTGMPLMVSNSPVSGHNGSPIERRLRRAGVIE